MFLLKEVKKIIALTHPNTNVQTFYYEHLDLLASEKMDFDIEFSKYDNVIKTCLILFFHTEKIIKEVISSESEDKKKQADKIILSLTLYSLIGKLIFEHVAEKDLAVELFMFFNDCQSKRTNGFEYSDHKICNQLKKQINL